MTAIALVLVINHYHINGLHLFWDKQIYKNAIQGVSQMLKLNSSLLDLLSCFYSLSQLSQLGMLNTPTVSLQRGNTPPVSVLWLKSAVAAEYTDFISAEG